MFIHRLNEAIKHQRNATQGVNISDIVYVSKTGECKTWSLFQLHQIVTWALDKSESSDKPFHQVKYNLIQLDSLLNINKSAFYFAYSSSDFNQVFTHLHKFDVISIIKKASYNTELIQWKNPVF